MHFINVHFSVPELTFYNLCHFVLRSREVKETPEMVLTLFLTLQ